MHASITLDLSPLEGLEKNIVRKLVRKAQQKAAKLVHAKAVSNAEGVKRFGYLAKSFGVKVKTYKTTVVAIVGPKSKYVREGGTITRGPNKGKAKRYRPSYYLHLLEKPTKRSKARPVLAPALASTQSAYVDAFTSELKSLIAAELGKN